MTAPARTGAFFDLDGTLLPPPSLEWRFIAWLLARDEISSANAAGWFARCVRKILLDPKAALDGNKLYLAGLPVSIVKDWARSVETNPPEFSSSGIARLAWHAAQGHRTFLVSGTLAPLATVIAHYLPCPVDICATELDVLDGHWTGWLAGEHMSGFSKARAVAAQASLHGVALSESFAYGDSVSDIPMLSLVRQPVAVNPSPRLARIARRRGWQTCRWTGTQFADKLVATKLLPSGRAL